MYSIKLVDRNIPNLFDSEGNYIASNRMTIVNEITKNTGLRCSFCNSVKNNLTIEHIKPVSKFPQEKNIFSNMIMACKDCNDARRNRYNVLTPYDIQKYHEELEISLNGDLAAKKDSRYYFRIEETIQAYKLNRDKLKMIRKSFLRDISYDLDGYVKDVEANLDISHVLPFILLIKMKEESHPDFDRIHNSYYLRGEKHA